MPDAAGPDAAASTTQKGLRPSNSDRVGEELADDAHIWRCYDLLAKEDDERRTKSWDNGLNNLALFAGLVSAVTTAFIIEAKQDMQPDYAQLTFLVLNATAFGATFATPEFVIPPSARTVNSLWVASLVLSLSAALIAIMGKDWIGMYTSWPVCNPRQWAEMRTYRLRCVERWYMSEVIAAAPVLLHVSLLLFGTGLVFFISDDSSTHEIVLGLCVAAGALYLVTTLSAIVFSTSPFKSPATQMLRSAFAALFSYVLGFVHRPKRNLVPTFPTQYTQSWSLGWSAPPPLRRVGVRRPVTAIISGLGNTMLALIHSPLRTSEWITSSAWTDLSVEQRPELVADSLSWLNGASQAPEVFRALIFALGDLEIGAQVAPLVSNDLRTRFFAEMHSPGQHADYLTLSRYVLANKNLRGDTWDTYHIEGSFLHFNVENDPSLLCEDGLAAAVILGCDFDVMLKHIPGHVAQARTIGLLLPSIFSQLLFRPLFTHSTTVILILLENAYSSYLQRNGSFDRLEAQLKEYLDSQRRAEYTSAITTRYNGRSGIVELLTFLCCESPAGETAEAEVELIMHFIQLETLPDHRCLAYIFGDRNLRRAAWPEKGWSAQQLESLLVSINMSFVRLHYPDTSAEFDTQHEYNVALARTTVMLLSPHHENFNLQETCIDGLSTLLCPSEGILDEEESLEIIRLIIEEAALINILAFQSNLKVSVASQLGILATVTARIRCLLCNVTTRRSGEALFQRLVLAKVRRKDGEMLTWDLGGWIRTDATRLLEESSSSTAPLQKFHDEITAIYALCLDNNKLSAIWDRLGFPGGPEDMFLYPCQDVGEFVRNAEAPREASRESLQLGDFVMDPEEPWDVAGAVPDGEGGEATRHASMQH